MFFKFSTFFTRNFSVRLLFSIPFSVYLSTMVIFLRTVTNFEDTIQKQLQEEVIELTIWKKKNKKSNKVPTGLSVSLLSKKWSSCIISCFTCKVYWFCSYARIGLNRILFNLTNDKLLKMVRILTTD